MLKKRIAATITIKDGIVVQSIGFNKYLPVGKPHIALEFLNEWGIDELFLIDMSATRKNKKPDFDLIRNAAKKSFVPLTVGGGIKEINVINELMHCGADKISLNQSAIYKPELVEQAARMYGDQCVVISIDVIKQNQEYLLYDYIQRKPIELNLIDFALQMESRGAGEILLHSVDRDGSYKGYDIELIDMISEKVKIPVIASGGASGAKDMIEVFEKTKAYAATAGNYFHFYEHSVNITKSIIQSKSTIPIRADLMANYFQNQTDPTGRLIKKEDSVLEDLLYIKIEKELI